MDGMPAKPAPKPLIGLNTDYYAPAKGVPYSRVNAGYYDSILTALGMPIVIPPLRKDNFSDLDAYLDMISGLVMVGGLDLDPRRNGQLATPMVKPMHTRREDADRYLMNQAIARKLPVLAIGSSMQLLNVLCGGTLMLHLPSDNPKAMPHFDMTGGPHRHMVNIEEDSTLHDIFGTPEHRVNSSHHQAVCTVGRNLRVGARAPDGVIEAIETTDEAWFCIATQWHPECETASALDRQLFDNLVAWANKYEPADNLVEV
jgi:putative glutamine amidotransferase